ISACLDEPPAEHVDVRSRGSAASGSRAEAIPGLLRRADELSVASGARLAADATEPTDSIRNGVARADQAYPRERATRSGVGKTAWHLEMSRRIDPSKPRSFWKRLIGGPARSSGGTRSGTHSGTG